MQCPIFVSTFAFLESFAAQQKVLDKRFSVGFTHEFVVHLQNNWFYIDRLCLFLHWSNEICHYTNAVIHHQLFNICWYTAGIGKHYLISNEIFINITGVQTKKSQWYEQKEFLNCIHGWFWLRARANIACIYMGQQCRLGTNLTDIKEPAIHFISVHFPQNLKNLIKIC